MKARRRELKELFQEAAELSPADRETFLDRACVGDPALRGELERLLQHDAPKETFQLPAVGALRTNPAPPHSIGQYRVLRVLGRGGMGVVYEAEQQQPRRKVALKVIRTDLLSRTALHRFQHEVELLGRLTHPGIASIFAAGTEDNELGEQPYFAMELVAGKTLHSFAEERHLTPAARVALFLPVLAAVQYAHQKGIIHRDLKPSNILVDAAGQPKILDFGIARSTNSDLTPGSATVPVTAPGTPLGTIPYMSPEQTIGKSDAVDVRSDVYALGVILYELLTGQLPYPVAESTIFEAIRTIQEQEPTSLGAHDRALRGDIDTILQKALSKPLTRRYQSASEFSADLHRYLSQEPILARAPSLNYRFQMFVRRRPAVASTVVLVSLLLVLTLGFFPDILRERRLRAELHLQDRLDAAWTALFATTFDGSSAQFDPSKLPPLGPLQAVERGDISAALAAFDAILQDHALLPEAAVGMALALHFSEKNEEAARLLETLPPEFESRELLPALLSSGVSFIPSKLSKLVAQTRNPLDCLILTLLTTWDPLYHNSTKTLTQDALVQAILTSPRPRRVYYTLLAQVPDLTQPLANAVASTMDSLWPNNQEAQIAAAEALRRWAPKESLRRYEALKTQTDDPTSLLTLDLAIATILSRLGDHATAKALYDHIVQSTDNRSLKIRALHNCASMESSLGHTELSVPYYKAAVDLGHALSAYSLALIYADKGDLEATLKYYDKTTALDPALYPAYTNKCFELTNRNLYPERLLEAAEQALRYAPQHPLVLREVARAFSALGDRERAITLLQTTVELNPDDIGGFINLGYELKMAGRYREALPILERAVQTDATSLQAVANLHDVFQALAMPDGIIRTGEAILRLQPSIGAHLNVIDALAKEGSIYDALPHLEYLREHSPEDHGPMIVSFGRQLFAIDALEELKVLTDYARRTSTGEVLSELEGL